MIGSSNIIWPDFFVWSLAVDVPLSTIVLEHKEMSTVNLIQLMEPTVYHHTELIIIIEEDDRQLQRHHGGSSAQPLIQFLCLNSLSHCRLPTPELSAAVKSNHVRRVDSITSCRTETLMFKQPVALSRPLWLLTFISTWNYAFASHLPPDTDGHRRSYVTYPTWKIASKGLEERLGGKHRCAECSPH